MSKPKILLIGSTGFVGQHIKDALVSEAMLYCTTRQEPNPNEHEIHFDFRLSESWENILILAPDIIINSAGYGIVKEQTDVDTLYDVNYRLPVNFIAFLQKNTLLPFWLQIGTAFEYDLEEQQLREESACVPMTHYGMSKYLCSSFLQSNKNHLPFLILRPFAMFGPHESSSKFFPYLITAQRTGRPVALSTGEQQRDYFYVRDLADFIKKLISQDIFSLNGSIFNIGRCVPISLRKLAMELSAILPDFQPALWQWGILPQRDNENLIFHNDSDKAFNYGLKLTPLNEAFKETVIHYLQ